MGLREDINGIVNNGIDDDGYCDVDVITQLILERFCAEHDHDWPLEPIAGTADKPYATITSDLLLEKRAIISGPCKICGAEKP